MLLKNGDKKTRALIMERMRTRAEVEQEFKRTEKLKMEILSRISTRPEIKTAYEILQRLNSMQSSELKNTRNAVLNAEEQMRNYILERVCNEKNLTWEQQSETTSFLAPLTLSELEQVELQIFGENTFSSASSDDTDEDVVGELIKVFMG